MWEYVEPLVVAIDNDDLIVRLEPPVGEGDVRQIRFRKIANQLLKSSPRPDGSFRSDAKGPPVIDWEMECASALNTALRPTR